MADHPVHHAQLVAYAQGQHFGLHHDAGTVNIETKTVELAGPVRIATFFVYLNTLPDNVGHTEFPWVECPFSVRPVAGRAVLFSNITSDFEADPATSHRAIAVRGDHQKLGMNVWVSSTSQMGHA